MTDRAKERKRELLRRIEEIEGYKRLIRYRESPRPSLAVFPPVVDPDAETEERIGAVMSLAGAAFADVVWSKFGRNLPGAALGAQPVTVTLEAADMPSVLGRSLLSVKR